MILLLACLLIGPFLLVCLALSAIRARDRAIRVEGALSESRRYGEQMRDIAARAIDLAVEAAKEYEVPAKTDVRIQMDAEQVRLDSIARAQSNYVAPIVAYCKNCNVSVRHEAEKYPLPCPACKTLIDPVLDNPPEL